MNENTLSGGTFKTLSERFLDSRRRARNGSTLARPNPRCIQLYTPLGYVPGTRVFPLIDYYKGGCVPAGEIEDDYFGDRCSSMLCKRDLPRARKTRYGTIAGLKQKQRKTMGEKENTGRCKFLRQSVPASRLSEYIGTGKERLNASLCLEPQQIPHGKHCSNVAREGRIVRLYAGKRLPALGSGDISNLCCRSTNHAAGKERKTQTQKFGEGPRVGKYLDLSSRIGIKLFY